MRLVLLINIFHFGRSQNENEDKRPNIIFVMPDDLGWSDVSWNNHILQTTPFIGRLVEKKASILKQSYSTHRCTPSRASFLTGRYAFRFGLGSDPISLANPKGMSLKEKLLPEFLKEAGYLTHAIGKWHLGYCNSSYLPHNRGFDTHYGHYAGSLDYKSHAISGSYGTVLNHFENGEPVIKPSYNYSTFDWGERTQEIFNTNKDRPQFAYLAFNAPHERVSAPKELIQKFKALHPGIDGTRHVQMAAVYAMDLAMEALILDLRKFERETIIIFHSDNGGSLKSYSGDAEGQRSCEYPYRGFKNSLFEGGTLSPSFIHSTKRIFPLRQFDNIVHITDWLPTILNWAEYKGELPRNLDGIDHKELFDADTKMSLRKNFIYGLINTWNEDELKWTTQYAVRYGKYKFMNFQRNLAQTSKCPEGWVNNKHEKYLFPNRPHRENMMKKVNTEAHSPVFKPVGANQRTAGYSLFNLVKDPFELNNLGIGSKKRRVSLAMMTLQSEIQSYVAEEIQKGFEYPITGKKHGKLFKSIISKLSTADRVKFFHESGRFKNIGRVEMTGFLGTDWCPSTVDDDLFLKMYHDSIQRNNTNLEYMIDMQLWDGYGPQGLRVGGKMRSQPMSARFELPLAEDIWDDDDL